MRLPFCLICVALAFGTGVNISGAAQSTFPQLSGTPGFSISISTPESMIKPGTEPILNVVFTNISNHDIQLALDEANYRPEARDENGELARLTAYGQKLTAKEPQLPLAKETSFLTVPLQPGETAKAQINISSLFDLSWPGKYTISVHGYDQENGAPVQSNEIRITVIQVQCPDAASSAPDSMSSPPLSITLSTKHHAVKLGSRIEIGESITNLSRSPVEIIYLDYVPGRIKLKDIFGPGLELKDPGGCPVKVRKDLQLPSGSFFTPAPIRPRETQGRIELLSNTYDFSQPGIYSVQKILKNLKTGQTIKSNILTITLFEGCTSFGAGEYSGPVPIFETTG
jgi:hypothetical protein